MNFFPGQGKVREFVDGQGNLERTLKVREKSGNLKINGFESQGKIREFENKWLWQADFRNLFFSRGEKMYLLMRQSKPISPLTGGYS